MNVHERYLVVAQDSTGHRYISTVYTSKEAQATCRCWKADGEPWRTVIIDLATIPELQDKVEAKA